MAPTLTEKTFPLAVREADLDWVDIGVRPGYQQKYQGFFDASTKLAVRVGSLYADRYYHSPRHKHTFQQIRLLMAGTMRYGTEVYVPGDCLYIPEGASYGPVKPEVDPAPDEPQMHFVDMQFQGPSGIPYPDPDDVVAARVALSELGEFKEGIYTDAEGKKHDAYEAILARLMGVATIEYPEPIYKDYVVMRSYKFHWLPLAGVPGARIKHLGHFSECGPSIKLVSLDAGAALPAGVLPAHQSRILVEGQVEFDGSSYESFSFMTFPRDEPYGAVTATAPSTMLAVSWLSGLEAGEAPTEYDWLSVRA